MTFHQRLRDLDHTIVGSGLLPIPTGRAYHNGATLYADKIHVFPFGEKLGTIKSSPLYPKYEHGSLYMGTAGLMNFGHIRNIRPSYAILFDVNPYQTIFWNVVLSGIKQNAPYQKFLSFLDYSEVIAKNIIAQRLEGMDFSAHNSMTNIFHDGHPESLSRQTFQRNALPFSAYLEQIKFSQQDYNLLHGMVGEGRIGTLTLDVFDIEGWQQLSGLLNDMRTEHADFPRTAAVLYVSSIFRFVKADTDWTGRPLNAMNDQGIFSVLDPQKSVVIDSAAAYSVAEFQTKMKDNTLWPSPRQAKTRESVPVHGAGRSAPHFV